MITQRRLHAFGSLTAKHGEGKLKWVPAPIDAEDVLKPHLERRKLQGATGEDLVFPFVSLTPQNRRRSTSTWGGYRKEHLEKCWERVTGAKDGVVNVDLTWYEATRHSFISRNLKAGVQLEEVSAAVGHASPATTKRHYGHFVRMTFNPVLRQGLAPARGK